MLNRLIDELCGRNVLSYSPPATGVADLVDFVPPGRNTSRIGPIARPASRPEFASARRTGVGTVRRIIGGRIARWPRLEQKIR